MFILSASLVNRLIRVYTNIIYTGICQVLDFFTIFIQNFSQRLPWQRQFLGKNTGVFFYKSCKNLFLRNDMKYLGAFNRKPVLSYSGSFLVTLVYNIFRQNGQFWDKNISFEVLFLGKWKKRMI